MLNKGLPVELRGLKTCDSCRKAMKALEAAGYDAVLRDIRADPMDAEELARAWDALGPALLNTRSTTWRGLSEAEREGDPKDLIAAHPSLMKRPVLAQGETLILGLPKEL